MSSLQLERLLTLLWTLALNRHGQDFSQLAAPLDDLKFHLGSWFSCSEVVACRRSANKAAHELAILGKNCNAREPLIWEVDVPATVARVVLGDLPQLYIVIKHDAFP